MTSLFPVDTTIFSSLREQPVDTSTAAGKAFFDMLGVLTNLRRKRQAEGIKTAKRKGVYHGRTPFVPLKAQICSFGPARPFSYISISIGERQEGKRFSCLFIKVLRDDPIQFRIINPANILQFAGFEGFLVLNDPRILVCIY